MHMPVFALSLRVFLLPQNAIIEKNEKGKLKIEPIKEEEIERAIKNLKPGKSPDIDGISAEHYKNAMDVQIT
jgi:hypothetical protein